MAGENQTFLFVIAYDIPVDKRRTKVAKILTDYGQRVQFSVFEANLTNNQVARMRQRLRKVIVAEEDSVRYYRLCETCTGFIIIDGQGEVSSDPELYVV